MTPEFEDAWLAADSVPGWLTRDQAAVLWSAATHVSGPGPVVEIGSHQGRSTVVLARAAALRGTRVVAVDPFVTGRRFGGTATRAVFMQNVAAAGVEQVVTLVGERSAAVRASWTGPVAMVYIDGKHDYWTAREDLRWALQLPPGSPLLLHDAFSSVGVTLAVLLHVLPGNALRYLGRTGSLARFQTGRPSAAERARLLRELPWFARNLVVKIALRSARPFGYRRADPY